MLRLHRANEIHDTVLHSIEQELDRIFKPSPKGSDDPYQLYPATEAPDPNIRNALAASHGQNGRSAEFTGAGGEPYLASLVKYPYKGGGDFTVRVQGEALPPGCAARKMATCG